MENPNHVGQGLEGRRTSIPQLITRGEADTGGAGRLTDMTASHCVSRDPYAQYELIPRAGHQAHQDQPEIFNELLLDFLSR
ncbi:alpha/beta fold hydrolase [Nesterenkonia ebinurensis]|uniref:alpha/beta fold hydrolase n=1 Tax=Nesterenkonia ebinurensis TaxID=2608252 RepID=UPI00123DDD1D|nr:alpha/beta hydrolase [Nesterenkonia ebinurensis]